MAGKKATSQPWQLIMSLLCVSGKKPVEFITQHVDNTACLSLCLSVCVPAYYYLLPACLATGLLAWLPVCLTVCVLPVACLSARLSLPANLCPTPSAFHRACLLVCPPICPPTRLSARLFARRSACSPACSFFPQQSQHVVRGFLSFLNVY